MEIELPLDNGFLRRECPNCEREFKWHHGPTDGTPVDAPYPDRYTCPYCGELADPDQWFTTTQVEHIQEAAVGPAMEEASDHLERAFRGSTNVKFTRSKASIPHAPAPLGEPSDMVIVEPPCHPYEPIKISEQWTDPVHCLLCGARFTLD